MRLRENNEYRVFGPPGTGKTTYLSKTIEETVAQVPPNQVLVSSFTKAAAQELNNRDLPLPPENIGTLHAMCFRALGQPTLAEPNVKQFNEAYPDFALTSTKADVDESALDQHFESKADELYSEMQINRAKMIPETAWRESVKGFKNAWTDFKEQNGYSDFTDLIERATNEMVYPPNNCTVGIFDEVQDFTPLELKLVRAWGRQFDFFVLAGDDDQTLYSFTGATPDAFLYPQIPNERKRFLTQSYRVPKKVQALAEKIINRVSKREPKTYKPRDFEGEIFSCHGNYRIPKEFVRLIKGYLGKGKSVMVLATCAYMLAPTVKLLRDEAVPFSNIFKPGRGDWNPLTPGSGISTRDRIVAFSNPAGPSFGEFKVWTPEQLDLWIPLIKTKGILNRGGKKLIKDLAERNELRPDFLLDELSEIFTPQGLDEAVQLRKSWLLANATAQKSKAMDFPIRIMDKYGDEGVSLARKVTLGTIHSVKGAQADVVIMLPDLSFQAARHYVLQSSEGYDSIMRQFYVGVTRAKETLIIASPANPKYCFKNWA